MSAQPAVSPKLLLCPTLCLKPSHSTVSSFSSVLSVIHRVFTFPCLLLDDLLINLSFLGSGMLVSRAGCTGLWEAKCLSFAMCCLEEQAVIPRVLQLSVLQVPRRHPSPCLNLLCQLWPAPAAPLCNCSWVCMSTGPFGLRPAEC